MTNKICSYCGNDMNTFRKYLKRIKDESPLEIAEVALMTISEYAMYGGMGRGERKRDK